MRPTAAERYLRRTGVTPLVRPTRNQAEIDLLPPYGDPEVSVPAEIGTYLFVGAAAIAAAERLFG